MRICILTGKFGMGHMAAANAVAEHIKTSRLDVEVEITDWFDYASPKFAEQYYNLFKIIVTKGFKFYNKRYRLLEDRKTDQRPELYRYFNYRFKKYIEEKQPDIIISTLPICSQITSLYKEKTGASVLLITCVTDITGHSEWINKNTDFYMVGSYIVKDKFIHKGVSAERIYETGIPVRLGFTENKVPSKRNRSDIKKNVLIMGGGLGMLPEGGGFYEGLEQLTDVNATIITGKNYHLYTRLTSKYKNITVLGFVNNVHDYMKQADVIITKPGGVTIFEAIFTGVPILALNPFLQQEIYNANYVQAMGIGKIIDIKDKNCLFDLNEMFLDGELDLYRNNVRCLKSRLKGNLAVFTEFLEDGCRIINSRKMNGLLKRYNKIKKEETDEEISFNI